MAEYWKCDGRGVICPTLRHRLQDGHKKGLNSRTVLNFKTGLERTPILVYRTSPTDAGVLLNYCPWCGVKLNREYRGRKPLAQVRRLPNAEQAH